MSEPTLFQRIATRVDDQVKRQDIVCPACGAVFNDGEALCDYVTYWGEDGPQDFECPECEAELVVNEQVTREFHVKIKDDQNETTS